MLAGHGLVSPPSSHLCYVRPNPCMALHAGRNVPSGERCLNTTANIAHTGKESGASRGDSGLAFTGHTLSG